MTSFDTPTTTNYKPLISNDAFVSLKPEVPSNTKKVNDPENLPTNQSVVQELSNEPPVASVTSAAPSLIVVSAVSAKKILFQSSISPEEARLTFSVLAPSIVPSSQQPSYSSSFRGVYIPI